MWVTATASGADTGNGCGGGSGGAGDVWCSGDNGEHGERRVTWTTCGSEKTSCRLEI